MSYKGKKNIYTCPQGHKTVTIDSDNGVTPMLIQCPQGTCTETARSWWYKLPEADETLEPEYEWFKPTSLKGYSAAMKEHIRKGGLDLRKLQNP